MHISGFVSVTMVFVLCISINQAWGWGTLGHELIVEHGNSLVPARYFDNCHVKPQQIIDHVSDPDTKWKHNRRQHPDEEWAHYFHVDNQPSNWKTKKQAEDRSQGFLVYRIANWVEDAKELRKNNKWNELNERLYGIAHYVGDLSMPMHLTKLHDGKEVGLPDLHKQWESTMVMRYYVELDKMVTKKLQWDQVPKIWDSVEFDSLIFNIAEQSYAKSARLFEISRDAMEIPRGGRHGKRRHKTPQARFVKSKLFEATGELAATQMALSSRIWAHTLSQICR